MQMFVLQSAVSVTVSSVQKSLGGYVRRRDTVDAEVTGDNLDSAAEEGARLREGLGHALGADGNTTKILFVYCLDAHFGKILS